jgi:hypothetical protein
MTLAAENIPPPINILDTDNPQVRAQKRNNSHEYLRNVTAKRVSTLSANHDDMQEALSHVIGSEIAVLLPAVARNVQELNNNAILAAIQHLTNTVNTRLARIEAKQRNSVCHRGDDRVIAPSNDNNDPVPAGFPTTITAINALTGQGLVPIETFYSLAGEGNNNTRKRAVRMAYGIGIVTKTADVLDT